MSDLGKEVLPQSVDYDVGWPVNQIEFRMCKVSSADTNNISVTVLHLCDCVPCAFIVINILGLTAALLTLTHNFL